jgi:molybdate transport system ATP-binding protein
MTIDVDISRNLGGFQVATKFVSNGRLVAIFGPSGSGKTSIINMIAGLIAPDTGHIAIDGKRLVDIGRGVNVPSHKRRIGYVFQEARLFPHLTVRQNLNFGKWFSLPKGGAIELGRLVELLGVGDILDRMPSRLSGGEKQRVAIGRALFSNPKLLLMDEPLASLDQARKAEIIPYIERIRDETDVPIIYVSHSVAEVARLASDIVVIANGEVSASGPTAEIMQRLDLFPAEERDETGSVLVMTVISFDKEFDMTLLRSAAGEIRIPGLAGVVGSKIRLHLRARDVIIANQEPKGLSALNILAGKVAGIKNAGPLAELKVDCSGTMVMARITRQSAKSLNLAVGMMVFAVVKTASIDASAPKALRPF